MLRGSGGRRIFLAGLGGEGEIARALENNVVVELLAGRGGEEEHSHGVTSSSASRRFYLPWIRSVLRNHLLCFSLACRGGEEGVAAGVAPHACRSQPLPERCYEAATALESLHALLSGVLQQRTEAGGFHRLASASHGRKVTLLILYFPETKKSKGKIYRSCTTPDQVVRPRRRCPFCGGALRRRAPSDAV